MPAKPDEVAVVIDEAKPKEEVKPEEETKLQQKAKSKDEIKRKQIKSEEEGNPKEGIKAEEEVRAGQDEKRKDEVKPKKGRAKEESKPVDEIRPKEEAKPQEKVKEMDELKLEEKAVPQYKSLSEGVTASFEFNLRLSAQSCCITVRDKCLENLVRSVPEPVFREVFCNVSLVKQRTEKVGISAIYERRTDDRKPQMENDDNITMVDVVEEARIKSIKKKRKKQKKREKVEIKVTPFDECDTNEVSRAPPKAELLEINVSRKRTISGTNDIFVDLDIEAGEEACKTDALIDLNFYDYDEMEISICELEPEIIEVDVLLDSMDEEDGVDAFPLINTAKVLTTVHISSEDTSISRLIEEHKLPCAEQVEVCLESGITKVHARKTVKMKQRIKEKDTKADEITDDEQQIIEHPKSVELSNLNETVTLTCSTTLPIKTASWFKNGMIVDTSDFISIAAVGNQTQLTLNKFIPFYIGVYHVVVDGVGSRPAKISANIAPVFHDKLPATIIHSTGKPLDIRLTYTAVPTPEVKLLHQGKPMILEADIDQYEDSVSIRIKNIKKRDQGNISICLANCFGRAVSSFELKLVDTPLSPRNARAVRLTATSLTLQWDSPEQGDCDVKQYTVERRITESGRWRKMGKTSEKEYTCNELIPKEFYAFRIIASNSFGDGLPSEVVEVHMPEEDDETSQRLASQTEQEIEVEVSEDGVDAERVKTKEEDKPQDETKEENKEKEKRKLVTKKKQKAKPEEEVKTEEKEKPKEEVVLKKKEELKEETKTEEVKTEEKEKPKEEAVPKKKEKAKPDEVKPEEKEKPKEEAVPKKKEKAKPEEVKPEEKEKPKEEVVLKKKEELKEEAKTDEVKPEEKEKPKEEAVPKKKEKEKPDEVKPEEKEKPKEEAVPKKKEKAKPDEVKPEEKEKPKEEAVPKKK
ncbi:unnamed protein product, partial [Angiostrongylus costaricensis]|uniref:Fibronectin type-III domain-containing protein n=1 Tax=Angiostrongylus costaricensis TaxID=334426 RepID=A0A0R3PID4_ANGCS